MTSPAAGYYGDIERKDGLADVVARLVDEIGDLAAELAEQVAEIIAKAVESATGTLTPDAPTKLRSRQGVHVIFDLLATAVAAPSPLAAG